MNTDISNTELWQRNPKRDEETLRSALQDTLIRGGSQRTVEYVHCYGPVIGEVYECVEILRARLDGESAEVQVEMTFDDAFSTVNGQPRDALPIFVSKLVEALNRDTATRS